MFWTGVFGFVLLLLVWDYAFKKHRNDLLAKYKIPGRQSLPLIGSALQFRGVNTENVFDMLRATVREHGKVFHWWVLHQLVVFSADPKDLEVLLSSPTLITKNNVYDMLSLWLGDGLLMSTGRKWHSRRKIITPSFHFKILEQFVEVMDAHAGEMVRQFASSADGATVIDIFPVVCLTALDIIAETSMGVKIEALKNPQMPYVHAVKTVTAIISNRLRRPTWRVDWMFRLTAPKHYNLMMENIDIMKRFTNNVIKQRRTTLEQHLRAQSAQHNTNEFNADADDVGSKKRMVLLDVLLQATADGQPLSNEDIREEVETFMFAGHDTTTSGISFTLYLIARHPEVQQRLFAEIRDVIGDDRDRPISYRELQNLKYMECVIKESLRMYPPVPIIGRFYSEDVEFNGKGLPGNTHFNVPIFLVLRDPDYFKDPDTFRPERFSGEQNEEIYPFALIPFSAGPRNCIGQKYAMLELKCTISKMLRHYELLALGDDVIPSLSLILRSKNGMNLGLQPRIY